MLTSRANPGMCLRTTSARGIVFLHGDRKETRDLLLRHRVALFFIESLDLPLLRIGTPREDAYATATDDEWVTGDSVWMDGASEVTHYGRALIFKSRLSVKA